MGFSARPKDGGYRVAVTPAEEYQTVEELTPGVHVMTVHHDDDCRTLRTMKAEDN